RASASGYRRGPASERFVALAVSMLQSTHERLRFARAALPTDREITIGIRRDDRFHRTRIIRQEASETERVSRPIVVGRIQVDFRLRNSRSREWSHLVRRAVKGVRDTLQRDDRPMSE